MTIQIKHFIDVADIVSLRFDCRECGASLGVSAITNPTGRIGKCPNCNHPWAVLGGSSYEMVFAKFTDALRQLNLILKGETAAPLGCSLMLAIKVDPEKLPAKS